MEQRYLEIIRLKNRGQTNEELLEKVRRENVVYSLSTFDIQKLRAAGVSEEVIAAMLASGRDGRTDGAATFRVGVDADAYAAWVLTEDAPAASAAALPPEPRQPDRRDDRQRVGEQVADDCRPAPGSRSRRGWPARRGRAAPPRARGRRRGSAAARKIARNTAETFRIAFRSTSLPSRVHRNPIAAAPSRPSSETAQDRRRLELEERRRDEQRRLHALARDHQQREREDAPERPRVVGEARPGLDPRLDVALQVLRDRFM